MTAFPMSCVLPGGVARGQAAPGPQLRYALPQSIRREDTVPGRAASAYALGRSGITCRPPADRPRGTGTTAPAAGHAGPQAAAFRVALPMAISRDATIPAGQRQSLTPAGAASPESPSGSDRPSPPAAPRDRTHPPIETLFPIVKRVARGISGAAGYAYMGEDPEGAGLRYGLLGLRLDTGDMGAALAIARDRDQAGFEDALGEDAARLLAATTAADRAARMAPVAGRPLWAEPWKSELSRAATRDVLRAAQNEYAVEGLLLPAADLLLAVPGLASGTALAMALDLLAELGREAGLATLEAALGEGAVTVPALKAALLRACPACRYRLEDLDRDPGLADWRPATPREEA